MTRSVWLVVLAVFVIVGCGAGGGGGGGNDSNDSGSSCNEGAGVDYFQFGSGTKLDSSDGQVAGYGGSLCSPTVLASYLGGLNGTAVSAQSYDTSTGAPAGTWQVFLADSVGTTGSHGFNSSTVQLYIGNGVGGFCSGTNGTLTYSTNTLSGSSGSVTGSFSGVTTWSCSGMSAPTDSSGGFSAEAE